MFSRSICRIVGTLFWIALVVSGMRVSQPLREPSSASDVTVADFLSGPAQHLTVSDPIAYLQVYDPVFLYTEGQWRQIGYIESAGPGDLGQQVQLAWYASDITASECELYQYHDSGSLKNVVATLFPPAKQKEIQDRIAAAMREHGEELTRAFVPLVRKSFRESIPIVEEEFRLSVRRHRGEIDQLADKWNREVVEKRLIPLAQREIMPIVRRHGQPVAEDIGRELWDRASLWRFGWRAIYDRTPLPQRDLVQGEWDRFVESEAVPVFEARMDDIVDAVQRTLRDVAANRAVRDEISAVADRMVQDPATRQLVRTILAEALVDNERLRAAWKEIWSSREAQQALNLAGDRIEPVVRKIGDDIFGSREEGINPDFARVLRRQILGKDRRWIVARHTGSSANTIQLAQDSMPYPIVYLANMDGESPE